MCRVYSPLPTVVPIIAGRDNVLTRGIAERARKSPKKVVFAEGDNLKVLKAAEAVMDEGVAIPILLGPEDKIREMIAESEFSLEGVQIIDPRVDSHFEERKAFGEIYFRKRMRKGLTLLEAERTMRERNYFGAMMVETGKADALISGMTRNYPRVIS